MTQANSASARQALLARIAHLCAAEGLAHVVLSPGSRSAPLTLAFAGHPGFQRYVVPDERSAGYLALGIAQQTGQPTVLICTSGTAALNYAPAVAEAFYQQVPLLALTADRPPEWIDQQDNQAIRQDRLYEPHVRGSFTLPADLSHPDARWHALRQVSEAIGAARHPLPGPVHVNVPLREPLYPSSQAPTDPLPEQASPGVIKRLLPATGAPLPADRWPDLVAQWQDAPRKLIVAGMMRPDRALHDTLRVLSARPDTAVIADVAANLFPDAAPLLHADAFLIPGDAAALAAVQPDLIISFGGPITSKSAKQFLRGAAPRAHWRIQPAGAAPDTFQNLSLVLPTDAASFLAELARRTAASAAAGYAGEWRRREQQAAPAIARFLDAAPFGEFAAVRRVLRALPAGGVLQLGNSMPIRYASLAGWPAGLRLAGVYSNRGVSGIDGTVSTAVGAALGSGQLTTLIVGDLGFFYDRNGLWHGHVPANLRIVVLNNHGGGIFDLIDGPERLPAALHERYFLTPHQLTAERTAADHGLDYRRVADGPGLDGALAGFFDLRPRAALLEIETEMAVNRQVFRQFKAMIATLA